jgi:diacylglycerol kinase family enzyme
VDGGASLGVLINARAGAVRRDPALVARLRARLPEGALALTTGLAEVEPALRALRDRGTRTLVVIGGDGSVGGTLTALLGCWPEATRPALCFAPGGTVNTIARSLGARGKPERIVERLLEGAPPRIETRRPVVIARAEGGAPRAGMIFANGVAVRWLELYYARSRQGRAGAAAVVGRIAGSALVRGRLARRLFEPLRCEVAVDGVALDLDRLTLCAASSVRHVGLGFRPFATAGSDPERFHFTVTRAGPGRIVAALPAVRLGRSPASLLHFSARQIALRFAAPEAWTLDADLFAPTRSLELGASAPLRFVVP